MTGSQRHRGHREVPTGHITPSTERSKFRVSRLRLSRSLLVHV
jgi:hypothetical protein